MAMQAALVLGLVLAAVAAPAAAEKPERLSANARLQWMRERVLSGAGDSTALFEGEATRAGAEEEAEPAIPYACGEGYDSFPFCDASLSVQERVQDLVSRLRLEEKAPMMTARRSPEGGVDRLGVPAWDWGTNAVHGVQSRCGMSADGQSARCPTSFPCPNGLGASFNKSVWYAMGRVISNELRALWLQGVGENHESGLPPISPTAWSPNINLVRDPRWGRNLETVGEDPHVLGAFGVAYTQSMQEGPDDRYLQSVVTLKHWAAYSLERDLQGDVRHNFDAIVSDYDFASTYFPAFRTTVQQGKAKGVMCSYNAINGVPGCAQSYLIGQVLRDTWGFDGYVTSDSGAVMDIFYPHGYTSDLHDAVLAALDAGVDIDSSFNTGYNTSSEYMHEIPGAVRDGSLDEATVDTRLAQSLKLRFELGAFDTPDSSPYWHVSPNVVQSAEHQQIALEAAQQSIVLLQNTGSVLPLDVAASPKLAVIGPHAEATEFLIGNYHGQICPDEYDSYDCVKTPFAALSEANTAVDATTTMVQGSDVRKPVEGGVDEAVALAQGSDFVVLMLGLDTQTVEREGFDRHEIDLPAAQKRLASAVLATGTPAAVVLINGGVVAVDELVGQDDLAILDAWYPGAFGSQAIADVIFGKVNPSAKLAVTVYPSKYVDEVDFTSMDMSLSPGRTYRYYEGRPLFEFGHGLSYTSFDLSWSLNSLVYVGPTACDAAAGAATTADVSPCGFSFAVTVTNTGDRAGAEVVQAYFRPLDIDMSNAGPMVRKQLFWFDKVLLAPQESTRVEFSVTPDTLALANNAGDLVTAPGSYQIIATNGIMDEPLVADVMLVGDETTVVPFPQDATDASA